MAAVWSSAAGVGAAAGALASAALASAGLHPWLAAAPVALAGLGAAGFAWARLAAPRARAAPSAHAGAPAPDVAPARFGREVLDLLPAGLLLIDAQGRIVYQNAAAEAVTERRVEGLHFSAALRAPALVEAISAALTEARAGEADATVMRSTERAIHAAIRPLAAPAAGGAAGALVLLEDRTRAAKVEALRRDFVANASHELKTPLASITGFIETLQGHARDDPEAAARFLGIMAAQAQRMKRLVDDLLSLNRIEINEHVQPREAVDLVEVVREVVAALAPLAAADGAAIEVALPAASAVVRGDREEIAQVFVNLIDNALKYAGAAGPVTVRLVEDGATRPGMVGVAVIDRGPGIAREHLPRLTERFYRVDAARSRERGGTGLGLAIAKHIMNRHRGELTVASVVGEGSRFTVWFPAAAADRRGRPSAAA